MKRHTHCAICLFLILKAVEALVWRDRYVESAEEARVSCIQLYWTNSSFSKRGIQILKNVLYLYYKGGNAHGC